MIFWSLTYHGGFPVAISNTVQPTLLLKQRGSNVKRRKKIKSTTTKINIQNSYSGVMIKFSYFSWITLNYLGKIKDESLRGQLELEAECILVQVNTGIKIFKVLSFVYFLLLFSFFTKLTIALTKYQTYGRAQSPV